MFRFTVIVYVLLYWTTKLSFYEWKALGRGVTLILEIMVNVNYMKENRWLNVPLCVWKWILSLYDGMFQAQAREHGQRLITWQLHSGEELYAILQWLGMTVRLWTLLYRKPLAEGFGRFIVQIGHMNTAACLVPCAPKWTFSLYLCK